MLSGVDMALQGLRGSAGKSNAVSLGLQSACGTLAGTLLPCATGMGVNLAYWNICCQTVWRIISISLLVDVCVHRLELMFGICCHSWLHVLAKWHAAPDEQQRE